MASTASLMLPWPVVTMTVTGIRSAWIASISFIPANLRHPQVGDDEAVGPLAQQRQPLGPVLGGVDLQPEAQLEQFLERGAGVFEVLDDEDALRRTIWHGRCNSTMRRMAHARIRSR